MSEGDVPDIPDLASSSDSELEENFSSNKLQNDCVPDIKSLKHLVDNVLGNGTFGNVEVESKLAQKAQNSGDESESSTDIDDDHDEDEDEDEDDEDGNDVAALEDVAHLIPLRFQCPSTNHEVEGAESRSVAVQQKLDEKFLSCLQQASMAFTTENYLSAASEYKLALMMLTNNKFESTHSDKSIIKYCLGLSHLSQKYYKAIRESVRVFQSIVVEEGESAVRVFGYLGLARAYLKQNRFFEAIQPLQDGIALMNEGVFPGRCLWPGTTKVIAETDSSPAVLKELFEQLLSDCRNPPLPLAVCRYAHCYDTVKTQMYLSDPEFKGYVQVVCIEKCVMEYHRECWREMKAKELDKRSDKELLSYPCITPDCKSTVCRIIVFGPDGKSLKMLNVEETASKGRKAGSKLKNISVHAPKVPVQKKLSGKKARAMAALEKAEEKAKTVEVEDASENKIRPGEAVKHGDDAKAHEGGVGGGDGGRIGRRHHRRRLDAALEIAGGGASAKSADPLVTMKRTDYVTLQKKKNEEQDAENLSKKAKKKKEKEKVPTKKAPIRLEVPMEPRPHTEEEFESNLNSHSLWTIPPFGGYVDAPSDNWLNPPSIGSLGYGVVEPRSNKKSEDVWDLRTGTITLRSGADNSEVSRNNATAIPTDSKQPPEEEAVEVKEEDVKGNIMSYFEMFLEKHGPCLTDDDLIQRELEAFPGDAQVVISEAGGLSNLLLQSVKFTVVDGYICLLKDAFKGRQKARERRMAMLSGSKFFKRFSGGPSSKKTNLSTADSVAGSGGNTGEEKDSSLPKKSDERVTKKTVSSAASDSVSAVEGLSGLNEMAALSSPKKRLTLAGGSESAAVSNDNKPRGKDTDNLFGLCDLNEYKMQLRQTNASSPIAAKNDVIDSFGTEDDDGNLSVIEKFKKQVHEAASKERHRARLAQTAASALASAKETSNYSAKLLLDGSKNAAIGSAFGNLFPATADSFGSLSFRGSDVKADNDKKFKKMAEPLGKITEQPFEASSLFDIDEDVKNKKVVGSIHKMTKSDPSSSFSLSSGGENAFKLSSALKITSPAKSSLSANASNFQFPGSKLNTGTTSATAGQKVNLSATNAVGSRILQGLHMNSLDYDFGNEPASMTSTSSGVRRGHEVKSGGVVFDAFGSRRRDHDGLLVEDRGMNTEQTAAAFGDYDRLKSEHDDLLKKYRSLAEKQLQIQNRHTEELHIVTEKVNRVVDQLENAEKKSWQLENESQQWKREKMIYEAELEKLRSDLNYTKISLESANHLVEVTNRLLSETKNGLMSEQEECRSVRDKYESLLNQLGRAVRGKVDRAEIPIAQPSSSSPNSHVPVTADPAARTVQRKPKPGFEKILNMLEVEFPNLSRIEMSRCVQEVRMSRNNSLSGLTVQEIVAKVREFILKEQVTKQLKKKDMLDLPYSMPNMVKYKSSNNGTFGGDVFHEEIDPCIICHEELSMEAASMLDCGHSFHTECVRKWFREQSTCPTCRNHALLPDEFPALGRTFFT